MGLPISIPVVLGGDNVILSLGMSAVYVDASRQVEVDVYLKGDDDVYHPDLIDSATAILFYKQNHELDRLSFDKYNGTSSGNVHLYFINPHQTTELTIRLDITIQAAVYTATQTVRFDAIPKIPLAQNIQPSLDAVNAAKPGYIPDSVESLSENVKTEPWQTTIGTQSTDPELLIIDFTKQYGYLVKGTGPVDYVGGGNRFLTKMSDSGLVYQSADELATELEAKTLVEIGSNNLATNPGFQTLTSNFPSGYSYSWDIQNQVGYTVGLLPQQEFTYETLVDSIKQLKIRLYGSGPFEGPRTFIVTSNNFISVSTATPLTLSILLRTIINLEDTITKTVKLLVRFFNAGGTDLGTREAVFDAADLATDNFALLELITSPAQYPAGTAKIKWELHVGSIESEDDLTVALALPQVEQIGFATSRSLGIRSFDDLTTPQFEQIEINEGTVEIQFVPGYDGVPSSDATFFDTRNVSGLNGFVAFHSASTGRLEFDIYGVGGLSASLTTSSSVSLPIGVPVRLLFSWKTNQMRIFNDNVVVATRTGSWTAPTSLNSDIQIGANYAKANAINSVVTFFKIIRTQPD